MIRNLVWTSVYLLAHNTSLKYHLDLAPQSWYPKLLSNGCKGCVDSGVQLFSVKVFDDQLREGVFWRKQVSKLSIFLWGDIVKSSTTSKKTVYVDKQLQLPDKRRLRTSKCYTFLFLLETFVLAAGNLKHFCSAQLFYRETLHWMSISWLFASVYEAQDKGRNAQKLEECADSWNVEETLNWHWW